MRDSHGPPPTSIAQRKAERELFFWTAFKALKLILSTTAVLYLVAHIVVSLVTNELAGGELVHLTNSLSSL